MFRSELKAHVLLRQVTQASLGLLAFGRQLRRFSDFFDYPKPHCGFFIHYHILFYSREDQNSSIDLA